MKLLLSSKGLVNETLTEHFLSFVGSRKTISIITTASSEYKEQNKNTISLDLKLKKLGFKTAFVDLEFDNPIVLKQTEIVIIGGGNPYYLLHHLKRSKSETVLSELIANQIPIWGVSAGFMILMKNLDIIDLLTPEMNIIGIKDKACLNVIEEIVIPHYDRFVKEGKILKEDIDRFEMESERKIIRLGEFQCLRYEDNRVEIIDAVN